MAKHLFKKEYCDQIIQMAKISGKPMRAFSASINVPYSVMIKWIKDIPDFAEAHELASVHWLNYWLDKTNEAVASINPDNPLLNIAKANIDRYYKETEAWYNKPAIDGPDNEGLSQQTGSSMSW